MHGKDLKKIVTSKRFYEVTFIVVICLSFLAWLAGIVLTGYESRQFDIFFLRCNDFFADTTNVVGYSSLRDVYENTMYTGLKEKAYPPLTYMLMYWLSKVVDMDKYYEADYFLDMYTEPKFLIIYLIYAIITVVMVYELVRTCKKGNTLIKIGTAAAVLLSAPVLFSFERANTIILTLFFVLFYIFYYDSQNKIMKELALISLAIAVAFKMTPAILGILLLYNKQWKEAFRAVIYGIIVGIAPFMFFEGGLSNIFRMFRNMSLNVEYYTSKEGCTLLASVLSFGVLPSEGLKQTVNIITYVVCFVLLVSAGFSHKNWEKIMAVSMVLIILPSHSGYYCILYIIPAVIAFLNEQEHQLSDIFIFISILLIMYDVQSVAREHFLNYHLSILLITGIMVIKGVLYVAAAIGAYRNQCKKDA
ncbi:MAG: glycosyltransferase family 87 protein [Lachnospiraceae bacterium]|nr:glycosyltransferase family 87 protein [Lachnospiraceae bacterium]